MQARRVYHRCAQERVEMGAFCYSLASCFGVVGTGDVGARHGARGQVLGGIGDGDGRF